MNDKFKTIFENLKKQGKLFTEYRDWNDYLERTRPPKETGDLEKDISLQAAKNEEPRPEEKFEDTLPPKEREQFLKMFGD